MQRRVLVQEDLDDPTGTRRSAFNSASTFDVLRWMITYMYLGVKVSRDARSNSRPAMGSPGRSGVSSRRWTGFHVCDSAYSRAAAPVLLIIESGRRRSGKLESSGTTCVVRTQNDHAAHAVARRCLLQIACRPSLKPLDTPLTSQSCTNIRWCVKWTPVTAMRRKLYKQQRQETASCWADSSWSEQLVLIDCLPIPGGSSIPSVG